MYLTLSCSSYVQKNLSFESSLVRSYTFDLENLKPLKQPFVAEYRLGKKQLVFIAVEHISSIKHPNLLKHPTLLTIEKISDSLDPELSIVEGIPTGEAVNPHSILPKAETCKLQNYQNDCGESFFVINKAREKKSNFISGEPTDTELLKSIQEYGYTTRDLVGFYFVRKIPQWKRQKNINQSDFLKLALPQLERYRKRIDPQTQFAFSDFESWYTEKMSTPKNYMDFNNNDPAPHGGPDATFVQRISNRVTFLRDISLLKRIEDGLSKHNRVLVVYGASHFINLEPPLTNTLGKPVLRKHY